MKPRALFLAPAVAACASLRESPDVLPPPTCHIVAYVRPTDRMDLSDVDARRLTHVHYTFADAEKDELVLRREHDPDGACCVPISPFRGR